MSPKREREPIKLSTAEILMTVEAISRTPKKRRADEFADFAKEYPMLYEAACQPNFDLERLKYMLNLKDSIDRGENSLEKASIEVGQKLFDIYVKDKVNDGGQQST